MLIFHKASRTRLSLPLIFVEKAAYRAEWERVSIRKVPPLHCFANGINHSGEYGMGTNHIQKPHSFHPALFQGNSLPGAYHSEGRGKPVANQTAPQIIERRLF